MCALVLACVGAACASTTDEDSESAEQNWDSADGNPSHPTHSVMAEIAITSLAGELPEVRTFKQQIVEGANVELHDKPLKNPSDEALRQEIGGNNWSADHIEILWQRARSAYASGDRALAYRFVGNLLHYAQDMGSPAHAFHVIHQNKPWNWDSIEVLGFFDFHADLTLQRTPDPGFANPVDYIEWSAQDARTHFNTAFPGQTYKRSFFPQGYEQLTEADWAFLRKREAQATHVTEYALRSAARALSKLR